ncbi:MAG: hypothetical protein ABII27_04810 [bacterium]
MSKIIICIHGLGNKPPSHLYKSWWKKSILKGLSEIHRARLFLNLELVYYADLLHSRPLDAECKDKNDPLFIKEPYVPESKIIQSNGEHQTAVFDQLKAQLEKVIFTATVSLNIDTITDSILRRYFSDLADYYYKIYKIVDGKELPLGEIIRQRLSEVLYKNRKKEILLIGHSMGSIIAYDVLRRTLPEVKIHSFVSVGSPLGISVILKKIFQQSNFSSIKDVAVPESIQYAWYNIFDPRDIITLGNSIRDYYKENNKLVKVIDLKINNSYEHNGKNNPHKIYGYLREEEFSAILNNFLTDGKETLLNKLGYKLSEFLIKINRNEIN